MQITKDERQLITWMLLAGFDKRAIADIMSLPPSSVTEEANRLPGRAVRSYPAFVLAWRGRVRLKRVSPVRWREFYNAWCQGEADYLRGWEAGFGADKFRAWVGEAKKEKAFRDKLREWLSVALGG